MTGSSNPNWKQVSFTRTLKVISLKTSFNSCRACPILFKARMGSTSKSPSGPIASVSKKKLILSPLSRKYLSLFWND